MHRGDSVNDSENLSSVQEFGRLDILAHLFGPFGSRDRRGDAGLIDDPAQSNGRGGHTQALCNSPQIVDEAKRMLKPIALKTLVPGP